MDPLNGDLQDQNNVAVEQAPKMSENRQLNSSQEKGESESLSSQENDCQYYAERFSLPRQVLFVFTLMAAQIVTQASVAQAVLLQYVIGKDFHVTVDAELSWHMAGYSLTVGTFILIAGRLGDMYGPKKIYLAAFAWYSLWSLITGISYYAKSNIFFSACRGLLGIGPSFLMPNAVAILGQAFKQGPRRNIIFSAFGACAPSGFLIGAVFSSLCGQLYHWQWAYYLACIMGAVMVAISYFVIPSDSLVYDRSAHAETKFDYFGAFTGVTGLILFNVAWNQGPIVGWQTPYTYILLIIGVLLLVVFVFIEKKVSHPLVPVSVLQPKVYLVLGIIAVGWSTFGIWLYYLWQIFLNLRNLTLLNGTAEFVPAAIFGVVASSCTALMFHFHLPVNLVLLCALLGFLVASILAATMPVDQIYWKQAFFAVLVAPFGMDMSFPAATILMSDMLPRQHQGTGASLVSTVVNYSISIGLGIAGTVESNIVSTESTPSEKLRGYRSALYTAIGLAGLGVALSSLGLFLEVKARKEKSPKSSAIEEPA